MDKSSKHYLFLDIDGVLNCNECFLRGAPVCNRMCNDDETGCDHIEALRSLLDWLNPTCIILSSAWRQIQPPSYFTTFLCQNGIKREVLGVSSIFNDLQAMEDRRNRGYQIQRFMDAFNITPDQITILDDCDDMGDLKPRLLQTTWQLGLTHDLILQWKG